MSGRRTCMEQDVESESFEQDLLHGSLEDFQLHGDQLANYSESTWQHPWFPLARYRGSFLLQFMCGRFALGRDYHPQPSTASIHN